MARSQTPGGDETPGRADDRSAQRRDDSIPEANYPAGYDETVRRGPPLDTSVSRGDYRPTRDFLTGAGVRGYGSPDGGASWGHGGDEGAGPREAPGMDGEHGSALRQPPGYGGPGGWGRLGGWRHGDNAVQRRSGPKGYKRSDDRIREDLCEHLMDMSDVDSTDVEVRVQDGHVTLEGTVPERFMRYVIEDVAATTLGVTDVENRLRVPRAHSSDDAGGA